MKKTASKLFDSISGYLKENPTVIRNLAIGGGAGILGGAAATYATDGPENETESERAKRALKNALIAGGLGAATGGLVTAGINSASTALPVEDVSPVTRAVESKGARGVGAVGGGVLASLASKKNTNTGLAKTFAQFNNSGHGYTISNVNDLKRKLAQIGTEGMSTQEALALQNALGGNQKTIISKLTELGINASPFQKLVERVKNKDSGAFEDVIRNVKNTQGSLPMVGQMGAGTKYVEGLPDIFKNKKLPKMQRAAAFGKHTAATALPKMVGLIKRHPGVAAAVAAGATLPEIISFIQSSAAKATS